MLSESILKVLFIFNFGVGVTSWLILVVLYPEYNLKLRCVDDGGDFVSKKLKATFCHVFPEWFYEVLLECCNCTISLT
jgi:hypothetical protein